MSKTNISDEGSTESFGLIFSAAVSWLLAMGHEFGLGETTSMMVGGIVGGGIYAALGVIVSVTGPAAWMAYAAAGLIAVCAGYSYIYFKFRTYIQWSVMDDRDFSTERNNLCEGLAMSILRLLRKWLKPTQETYILYKCRSCDETESATTTHIVCPECGGRLERIDKDS